LSNKVYKRQLSPVIPVLVLYPVLYTMYIISRPRKGEHVLPEICLEKIPSKSLGERLKEFFQNQLEYLPPNSKYENIYATLNVHKYPTPENINAKHFKFSTTT
jgi:hypothetical protein